LATFAASTVGFTVHLVIYDKPLLERIRTASLNSKRGGLGQLGDGTDDARPLFDRNPVS
jgi:hypothetical protein